MIRRHRSAIYCNPHLKQKLLKMTSLVSECELHCRNIDQYGLNSDEDEAFKIRTFSALTHDTRNTLVPVPPTIATVTPTLTAELKKSIEQWPLIQAYGSFSLYLSFLTESHLLIMSLLRYIVICDRTRRCVPYLL